MHQQILDRHHTLQGPLCVHDITGVNGLLIHAVPADVGKCLLHGHALLQAHILCRHYASGAAFRIF